MTRLLRCWEGDPTQDRPHHPFTISNSAPAALNTGVEHHSQKKLGLASLGPSVGEPVGWPTGRLWAVVVALVLSPVPLLTP